MNPPAQADLLKNFVPLVQIGLVVIQVAIAALTIIINRRYYRGMTQRGEAALAAQNADVLLKHQQDNERISEKLRKTCEGALTAALDGTRPNAVLTDAERIRLANESLRSVLPAIADLRESFRGYSDENALQGYIQNIADLVHQYSASGQAEDPHADRVRLCAEIQHNAQTLYAAWETCAESRIAKFREATV